MSQDTKMTDGWKHSPSGFRASPTPVEKVEMDEMASESISALSAPSPSSICISVPSAQNLDNKQNLPVNDPSLQQEYADNAGQIDTPTVPDVDEQPIPFEPPLTQHTEKLDSAPQKLTSSPNALVQKMVEQVTSSIEHISTPLRRSTRTYSAKTPAALLEPSETPERVFPSVPLAQGTNKKRSSPVNDDSVSPMRPRRTPRKSAKPAFDNAEVLVEAMKPLTAEERFNWRGWVELESDPALFNHILRQYGVGGVKVQELLGLTDDMLAILPQPVLGLVFLFNYHEGDDEDEELPKCPRSVWFANQTTSNACATVAMLNILMNVPEANLGNALTEFREDTKGLKPPYRGMRLSTNDFVRNIHNSFARRMDMLNSDLALKNEFEKWEKSKKARKAPKRKKVANNTRKKKVEVETVFHYVAYVPIQGEVWRLDGLQYQPQNLGSCGDDWLKVARDHIMARTLQYEEDGVQFNLLSLCKSPLASIPPRIAILMKAVLAVESKLAETKPNWSLFVESDNSLYTETFDGSYGITTEVFMTALLPNAMHNKIEIAAKGGDSMQFLMDLHGVYSKELAALRSSYCQEIAQIQQEDLQAEARKVDSTPLVHDGLKALAEAGVLKEIVQDVRKS